MDSGTEKSAKSSVENLKRPVKPSERYRVTVTTDDASSSVDTTNTIDGNENPGWMIFKITLDAGSLTEDNVAQHSS